MAGLYEQFLSHLKSTGVAKSSHFEFSLPNLPFIVSDRFGGYEKILTLRCEATELPGRQLVSQDIKLYGPTYKTPYQSLYQEIGLTFIETSTLMVRGFFEAWFDQIFNSKSNLLNYPKSYRTDVTLTQYDIMKTGTDNNAPLQTIATWQLVNAFPTSVDRMHVSWDESGVHRTSVTLAYEWYVFLQPNTPHTSAQPSPQAPTPATSTLSNLLSRFNPFN